MHRNVEPDPFAEQHQRWDALPGHGRLAMFCTSSAQSQAACWDDLSRRSSLRIEAELEVDRQREEEWPRPKRHQPPERSTWATSTRPGAVAVSTHGDDPLKSVDLRTYFEAHGIVVPPNGKVNCIAPDHEDVHPSCSVTSSHFRCWSCQARGDIIDAASLFHAIPATGAGYWKLRDLVVETLVWAPLPRTEGP